MDHVQASSQGPLSGYVVVDLSRALAGPHAGMMLGDLGARVIKVEAPGHGDESRGWGPPFVGEAAEQVSTYFLSCNRNKESVTADLKSDEGRELLTRLVRHADILVENFRTGVLDRLGFGFDRLHEINPRLVILSITGFGHDGPAAGRAGYDQIAQGEAGLMSITGEPGTPTKVGVPIADLLAGMYGASGVLAALLDRERTGRGQVVRTSLLASVVGVHAFQGTRWTVAGDVPEPTGNHHAAIAPYGLFRAADGALQVAVGSEAQWRSFVEAVGLTPDDPRFTTNAERVHHRQELIDEIERVFATAPCDHWLGRLEQAGIACGKVRTLDQVYEWEQTRSQGLLVDVEHPELGSFQLPGPPLRFDGAPARDHAAPPLLGEHNQTVREWLDELDGLDRVAERR
ncbi:CaiB/BaiF CoA transferase family protein [Phytoactinopolyspora limicola]|uniref:CaiB/BaiF CoA transferase family protein n=1 Tax=Phytoactinopolyspora limicola TaxID=2715536 RepID=UPI001A9CB8CD|nr:CoA transferase [Phytoactinopolyspora limicola]